LWGLGGVDIHAIDEEPFRWVREKKSWLEVARWLLSVDPTPRASSCVCLRIWSRARAAWCS
jgi:hypothetical protein